MSIKTTPQYQTLLAVLKDEAQALAAYDRLNPAPAVDPIAELVAAGFTQEQAVAALTDVAEVVVVPDHDVLREAEGFKYAKGRVYGDKSLAKAICEVLNSGAPQLVRNTKVENKGVLVYVTEGSVTLQNVVAA